jgi:hypothetical protein
MWLLEWSITTLVWEFVRSHKLTEENAQKMKKIVLEIIEHWTTNETSAYCLWNVLKMVQYNSERVDLILSGESKKIHKTVHSCRTIVDYLLIATEGLRR